MRRRSRPLIISDPAQKRLMVTNRTPTNMPAALNDEEITWIILNIQSLFSFDRAVKDA